MKVFEVTDIVHDQEEHVSTVDTTLFESEDKAIEYFNGLVRERIQSIVESFEDENEEDLLDSIDEVNHIFEYTDEFTNYTTTFISEKEIY